MTWIYLATSCLLFIELWFLLGLGRDTEGILARSHEAMKMFAAADVDDAAKETYMRRAAAGMLGATLTLAAKFLVIGLVLYALYALVIAAFPDLRAPILGSFTSPFVVIVLTVAAFAYVRVRHAILRRL
ncbi:MAG: hypothetical protein IT486_08855 [Gammaproteobacteria bacterium]|nr:hypothetical protein [Gammaproteobacteria bacterium]